MVCFNGDNCNMKDKPGSGWPCTAICLSSSLDGIGLTVTVEQVLLFVAGFGVTTVLVSVE